jgi:hypothetical protein
LAITLFQPRQRNKLVCGDDGSAAEEVTRVDVELQQPSRSLTGAGDEDQQPGKVSALNDRAEALFASPVAELSHDHRPLLL